MTLYRLSHSLSFSLSLSLSFSFVLLLSSTLLIAYNKISFNLPNISRGSSMVPGATRAFQINLKCDVFGDFLFSRVVRFSRSVDGERRGCLQLTSKVVVILSVNAVNRALTALLALGHTGHRGVARIASCSWPESKAGEETNRLEAVTSFS